MASTHILIEDLDHDYELLEEDILEYAKQIGIDVENEKHLMWIAEEGLAAKVPEPWLILSDGKDRIFYYNKNTGETSWLHPLDKEYSAVVSEERIRSKGVNSSSSDCGFESKKPLNPIHDGSLSPGRFPKAPLPQLSSLADAPPLSSSGKNTPSSFKSGQNENVSSKSKKLELGHFENRRGTQLAPVRLNSLKMPMPSSQKSGTGMSFMPKGSALSKNVRRSKGVSEHSDSLFEDDRNRNLSAHEDYNESENSDDGSKYSYEETDYEEEKDAHSLDPYDLGDASQLSPIYSADESPEAFDINSLVQLGTKGQSKLDVQSRSSQLLINNESSPSLSLRKIGQPSFLKPLQSATKKKTTKNSKNAKKGNNNFNKYDENQREIENKISAINEEQKLMLENIQREWVAMQEELEREEKAKYEQMVNESSRKLEEEELKMRKENSAKLSELKNELMKKLKDEENASEKSIEELKKVNQVKYNEEEQKFKKELETLSENMKAEVDKMEEKNALEINKRKKKLEDQLKTEVEELRKSHEINLKDLEETHITELSMLEKAHQEELVKIKTTYSKEMAEVSTQVEGKEIPKTDALQQEVDKLQKLLAEMEEKYQNLSKECETLTTKIDAEKEVLSKLSEETTAAQNHYEEIQDEVEKAENDLDHLMTEKSALISELNTLKDNISNEKSNLLNLEKVKPPKGGKSENSDKCIDIGINTTLLCLATLCQFTQTYTDCKDVSSQINGIQIFKTDVGCQTIEEKSSMVDKICQVKVVPYSENISTNFTKNENVITNAMENSNVDKANSKVLENALNGIGKQMESRIRTIEEQLTLLQEKLSPVNNNQSFKSYDPSKHPVATERKYLPNPCDINILPDPTTDKASPSSSSSTKITTSNSIPRQSKCMCEEGDPESCEVMQAVKNSVYQLNDVLNLSFEPSFRTNNLVYGFNPISYSSPIDSFYVQFRKLQEKHRITDLKHKCENATMKQFKGSMNETGRTHTNLAESDFIRSSVYTSHLNQNTYKKDDDLLARAQNIVLREQSRPKKQQQQLMDPSIPENILHPERHIMTTDNFSQSVHFNVSRSFSGLPSPFLNFEPDPETDYNRWMARLNALQQKIRSHKIL